MDSKSMVAMGAMVCGTLVTITNICLNGDGVSTTALFALVGTVTGYVFGKKEEETKK